MEIEDPGRMCTSVLITRSQLLVNVHIAELQIIVFVYMVMKPCEEPVLIVHIINDLFSKIYKYFIA